MCDFLLLTNVRFNLVQQRAHTKKKHIKLTRDWCFYLMVCGKTLKWLVY